MFINPSRFELSQDTVKWLLKKKNWCWRINSLKHYSLTIFFYFKSCGWALLLASLSLLKPVRQQPDFWTGHMPWPWSVSRPKKLYANNMIRTVRLCLNLIYNKIAPENILYNNLEARIFVINDNEAFVFKLFLFYNSLGTLFSNYLFTSKSEQARAFLLLSNDIF